MSVKMKRLSVRLGKVEYSNNPLTHPDALGRLSELFDSAQPSSCCSAFDLHLLAFLSLPGTASTLEAGLA